MNRKVALIAVLIFSITLLFAPCAVSAYSTRDAQYYNRPFDYNNVAGVQSYRDKLERYANQGDKWAKLKKDEVDKELNLMNSNEVRNKTSWFHPIDKVVSIWKNSSAKKDYAKAVEKRKNFEGDMAGYGYVSPAKRAENSQRGWMKLLGDLGLSPVASEGSKVLRDSDRLANDTKEYNDTFGLFHPIKKWEAYKKMKESEKRVADGLKRVDVASKNDPIYQVGKVVGDVANIFSNLFGNNKRNVGRIDNSRKCKKHGNIFQRFFGSIFGKNKNDDFQRSIDTYSENSKRIGQRINEDMNRGVTSINDGMNDINNAFSELERNFKELGNSLKGIGDEFSKSINDAGKEFSKNYKKEYDRARFGTRRRGGSSNSLGIENLLDSLQSNSVSD